MTTSSEAEEYEHRAEQEGKADEQLVLQSFELVRMPAPSTVEPNAELSIAAAALLASITTSTCHAQLEGSPASIVVTATVPLVEHAHGACAREALKDVPQMGLVWPSEP